MDKPVLDLTNIDFTDMYDCFADHSFQLSAIYANQELDEAIIYFFKQNYTITTECVHQYIAIMKELAGRRKVQDMELLWASNKKTRQEAMWKIFTEQAESSGWGKYDT